MRAFGPAIRLVAQLGDQIRVIGRRALVGEGIACQERFPELAGRAQKRRREQHGLAVGARRLGGRRPRLLWVDVLTGGAQPGEHAPDVVGVGAGGDHVLDRLRWRSGGRAPDPDVR